MRPTHTQMQDALDAEAGRLSARHQIVNRRADLLAQAANDADRAATEAHPDHVSPCALGVCIRAERLLDASNHAHTMLGLLEERIERVNTARRALEEITEAADRRLRERRKVNRK